MEAHSDILPSGFILQGGKYRIVKLLGQGGFGITYEAIQVSLHRRVAIKEFYVKSSCGRDPESQAVTIPASGKSEIVEKFKKKFVREAEMIAAFDNDNIVKIYDVFEENSSAYYVMEYIGGGSLENEIKEYGSLPEAKCLEYIRQIASALSYIHKNNVLHLDLKPANILRCENGRLKLIDFGISKHYDEVTGGQTSITPVGISSGYAPIEQYQQGADLKNFLPATDIYALGATLMTLLTGKVPPESISLADGDFPAKPENVSAVLWSVVQKAMSPSSKNRPQSVEAFLELISVFNPQEEAVIDEDEETKIIDDQPETGVKKKSLTPIICTAVVILIAAILYFSKNEGNSPVQETPPPSQSPVLSHDTLKLETGDSTSVKVPSSKKDSLIVPAPVKHYVDGHEFIDLGLSVCWSTTNIGASSPSDYGGYYSWGEVNTKSVYNWSGYKFWAEGDSYENVIFSKYSTDALTSLQNTDDAAYLLWGNHWRIPSANEWKELKESCIWKWTSMSGHRGFKVTSKKNGKSIFIPASGWHDDIGINYLNQFGYYWSSTLDGSLSYSAYTLCCGEDNIFIGSYSRDGGQSLRPVTNYY